MKKYPFSNKAMKAILAASIALSPFASTALSNPVKVEASSDFSSVDSLINYLDRIYDASDKVALNKAKEVLDGITDPEWKDYAKKASVKGEDLTPAESKLIVDVLQIFTSVTTVSGVKDAINNFDKENVKVVFGDKVSSKELLNFLSDVQIELLTELSNLSNAKNSEIIEILDAAVTDAAFKNASNKKVVKEFIKVVDDEKLVTVSKSIYAKLDKDNIGENAKAALIAALKEVHPPTPTPDPDPDPDGNTNPTIPTPGEETVGVPAGSTTVVEKGNDVITEIPEDKVQEIVNLITAEKSVVEIPLEKVSGDKQAKAQIPASLFTEAAKKNSNAVVAIKTDAAVYKLPVSEINVTELAKKLGVAAGDVKINISVNVVSADVKNSVSNVVEFHILAVSGDKQEAVTTFSTYVERVLTGAKDFSKGNSVAVKLNADGSFTSIPTFFDGKNATVKSLTNSKYTVIENNVTFKDVTSKGKDYWAKEYIETLASKLIVKGKEEGKYVPADHMTRAEFTVLLVRALGLPAEKYDGNFKDVKGTEWFNANGEIMAAVKHGLIEGMDNGTFAPKEKITRAQAAVMIDRAMKLKYVGYDMKQLDSKKTAADFKDASKFKAWNKKAIEAVYQADIVSGRDTKEFDPNGFTKRDEMAKIISEFLTSAKLMN
ncbi:S-layer homology domain-containing protein [Cytobacillus sp. FJAT-53684]|uniref:S-layer homology domain-containing protein n=1 Tax=Cytobacillus mangrovibacter TaxID=3299024 RepID=A0ABW6JX67_9BACI